MVDLYTESVNTFAYYILLIAATRNKNNGAKETI